MGEVRELADVHLERIRLVRDREIAGHWVRRGAAGL
jgi:hypothetical protein